MTTTSLTHSARELQSTAHHDVYALTKRSSDDMAHGMARSARTSAEWWRGERREMEEVMACRMGKGARKSGAGSEGDVAK